MLAREIATVETAVLEMLKTRASRMLFSTGITRGATPTALAVAPDTEATLCNLEEATDLLVARSNTAAERLCDTRPAARRRIGAGTEAHEVGACADLMLLIFSSFRIHLLDADARSCQG